MYKKILLNVQLPLKKRIKRFVAYYTLRRGARILWRKRFAIIFKKHPEFKQATEIQTERDHAAFWKYFNRKVNYATLRVCKNISGVAQPFYIPEEVFVADIEPSLNNTSAVEYLTFKSLYNRYFSGNIFPKPYFHNMDGEYLDADLNPVSFTRIEEISKKLNYPLVFKPNKDSIGGKDVFFPKTYRELIDLVIDKKNFVVQEKIKQHAFFSRFNSNGLNTIRVCLYRSVKDNHIHILNCALRMGVGGSLDNLTAGGIVSFIKNDGFLHGYALDKYGKKFYRHPDTQLTFEAQIPKFSVLRKLAISIMHKVFYSRITSLDLCLDEEGNWRVIEINIFSQTTRFSQYAGHPFFGKFTDEVVEYCKQNHWAMQK